MDESKTTHPELIAFCGLYCAECYKYKKGKCPGCRENAKATWCKVRSCGLENNLKSCADCPTVGINECKKFKNPVSQLFAFIFNSDRPAGIQLIKDEGYDEFARYMATQGRMTIRRRGKK